jgi:hypothetical protein
MCKDVKVKIFFAPLFLKVEKVEKVENDLNTCLHIM